jgi:NhaP-type Na+/H+ or K+/H+ antiporter
MFLIGFAIGLLIGRFLRWTHRDDWRSDPPSERQIEYAMDLGIDIPAGCTKGEISELIDQAKRN